MASYAIVPAAGRSRRMGSPKLLLAWGDSTIIEQVLAAWRASRVDRILVVVHPEDEQLPARCQGERTTIVMPAAAPPEMKDSVTAALRHIEQTSGPTQDDCWLLAPADMPNLSAATIDRLLTAYQRLLGESRITPTRRVSEGKLSIDAASGYSLAHASGWCDEPTPPILVPAHAGRRGHPVLFPWALAAEVFLLPPDEGVNQLLRRHAVVEVPCDASELRDIDTPDDYQRLAGA